MIRNVFFDLDGTLTDPAEGITKATAYALRQFGIEERDYEKLCRFIGPPLTDSFREYYGFSPADALEAQRQFRVYYINRGVYENRLYEGAIELLSTLKARGKTLILATSKPDDVADTVLSHFGIGSYFDFRATATVDNSRVKKEDVIGYGMEIAGITEPESCIMVGDRRYDIKGAKAHGMRSVASVYGYGGPDECREAGADFFAESPIGILSFIP